MSSAPAVFVPLAAAIKSAAPRLPIFHASRIVDPLHADRLVAAGQIDVVGMTRALIADPELPRKAREGRLDDIRRCVGANEGCIDRIYQGKAVTCVQNPATGREGELGDVRPATAKHVVVVGGGVAGLEAARVAALRGCWVGLREKAAELGGQVLLAACAPARAEYAGIIRFLGGQVRKLGVDVRLGVEATAALVLGERPDAVVVATGSHPYIPPVPGSDGKHVVTDRDVLGGDATVGGNVVVIDDVHTEQALSTAELLLDQGKRVEVISPLFYVGQDIGVTSIAPLYTRLYTKGAVLTPCSELRAVEGSTVVVRNVFSGAERRIESVDRVIPDPVNLRAGDLPRHASEQGRKLGREEKQPGRKRKVHDLLPIHASDVRHVAHDPVEMTDPAKQQAVVEGHLEVDDRELTRAIDREQVDLAARRAWDFRIKRSEPLLERAVELHQGGGKPIPGDRRGPQKGDTSPGPGRSRQGFGRTSRRAIAGRRVSCLA